MNADVTAPLMQLGVAGAMLWWFMARVEKKLDTHTSVINDLAQAITLDVLTRDTASDAAKQRADVLLERVTSRKSHLSQ